MDNEIEDREAKKELDAMMVEPAEYRTLKAAVAIFKVLAVLYLLATFYELFLAASSKDSHHAAYEDLETATILVRIVRDTWVAFFVFVSGEVIQLLLDMKRFMTTLRR